VRRDFIVELLHEKAFRDLGSGFIGLLAHLEE